jgi:hypothetical protein
MTDEKPSAEVETSETTTVGNKAGDADSGTNSTASGTDLRVRPESS